MLEMQMMAFSLQSGKYCSWLCHPSPPVFFSRSLIDARFELPQPVLEGDLYGFTVE